MSRANFFPQSTPFHDVIEFHKKFGLSEEKMTVDTLLPRWLPENVEKFRLNFIQEEFDELKRAIAERNMPEVLDALVDLTWVTLGMAELMNLPFSAGWEEVRRANMSKVKAESAEQSKRGAAFDIIKPEGWTAPDQKKVLEVWESLVKQTLGV